MRAVDELRLSSQMICVASGCAGQQHHCYMFAFLDRSLQILDVCASHAFPNSEAHAIIPLPWYGDQQELETEVAAQCAAWARYYGWDS